MKSKILALLCLVAVSVMAFVACDDEEGGTAHTHTFSSEWTSNETHHWHKATCAHGENKQGNAEHTDADGDGLCDVCAYVTGHEHTYAEEWQYDETHHWQVATCESHPGKVDETVALHADALNDGVCDVCGGHVHVFTANSYGFCIGCDKQTEPIDETKLGSLVYAASSRKNKIISGNISYNNTSNNITDNKIASIIHDVAFSYGTNGTYEERSYTNNSGQPEVQEKWITKLADGNASGITVIKINGAVVNAEPSSFSADDLLGYYYTASTLADGHGAEALLKSLYEASQDTNSVKEFNSSHDAENKAYSFDFKTLIVHETFSSMGEEVEYYYNANYYEVEVTFTYNDEYALTSLSVSCDCYTNDAGEGYEADIDFDYDPATGAMIRRDSFVPDNYTITVTQTSGTRVALELKDGSEYAPTDLDVQYNGAAASSLELTIGQNVVLDLVSIPADRFMSFIKNDIVIKVTDKNGNLVTSGFSCFLHGYDELNLIPSAAGEYVVTITCKDIVKTVNIVVEDIEIGGTKTFEVVSTDNNVWNQVYEFKATATGTYTFYLPYGVAATNFSGLDSDGYPIFEAADVIFDYDNAASGAEGTSTFTKFLVSGQTYKICFKFRDKGVTYEIGYDEP